MAEYIERKRTVELLRSLGNREYRKEKGTIQDAIKMISYPEYTPTEDVAPVVHGRWTAQCVVETDGGWTLEDMPYNEYQHSNPICSVCRKTALLDGGEDYVTSPYCPNCGARMDGDENG